VAFGHSPRETLHHTGTPSACGHSPRRGEEILEVSEIRLIAEIFSPLGGDAAERQRGLAIIVKPQGRCRGAAEGTKKGHTVICPFQIKHYILLIELVSPVNNIGTLTKCFISFICTSHLECRGEPVL
jgi:hypothetical protein